MRFPRRKILTWFGCEDRREQRSDEEVCTVHTSSEKAGGAAGDGAGDIFDFEKLVLLLPKVLPGVPGVALLLLLVTLGVLLRLGVRLRLGVLLTVLQIIFL